MTNQFEPKDKVLVLDFDHTCYDTDAFLLYEIRQKMLGKFDIPVKAWEESYEISAKAGYSSERHREELVKILNHAPYSLEDIKEFEKEINFNKYLYLDVLSFIDEAKSKGYKIMLLSFGEPVWQNKKVQGSGLDKLMDVIEYTKIAGGKAEVLRKYTEGCAKVIFIENNGYDIDEVAKALPYVDTYFMNRVPDSAMDAMDDEFMKVRYMESRKIAEREASHTHKYCHTFKEIIL